MRRAEIRMNCAVSRLCGSRGGGRAAREAGEPGGSSGTHRAQERQARSRVDNVTWRITSAADCCTTRRSMPTPSTRARRPPAMRAVVLRTAGKDGMRTSVDVRRLEDRVEYRPPVFFVNSCTVEACAASCGRLACLVTALREFAAGTASLPRVSPARLALGRCADPVDR